MDPITLAIGVAVTLAIGAAVALVSMFGFGGETEYEQQIARQKEILLDESKVKSADKKKVKTEKKKKVTGKSKAEGGELVSSSDMDVDSGKEEVDGASSDALNHPHIEYDPNPVIIEDVDVSAAPLSKAAKKNRKGAPSKSILVNKHETPLVRGSDAVIAETVFPEAAAPKDDVELRHKPKKAGKKEKVKQASAVAEPTPVVDEVVVPTQVKSQSSALVPEVVEEVMVATASVSVQSAPTKKSKAKGGASKGGSELAALLDGIEKAPLTKDELQTLVDSLLARQEAEDSWTTKSTKADPMALLKKQLEETQNALEVEQSNAASAQEKVHEMTAKWTSADKMSKGYLAQVQEAQKMNQKLKADSYSDRQKVDQQIELINQLTEENQSLKQSVANTDEVAQMQTQLKTLTAEKGTWSTQTAETEKALADIKHQLARLQESLKATETENAELKGRCNDLGQKLAQADTLSMEAQNRAKESEKNNKNLQDHIRSQQKDKESEIQALKEELTLAKQQAQAPTANGTHTNGEPNGFPDNTALENKISSLELSLQEKDTQLTNLNKQLAVARTSQTELAALKQRSTEEAAQLKDAEAKITTLETSVQTLKDKNNELAERSAQMSTLTDEVTSLKKELNQAKASLDSKDSAISQLEDSLHSERQKVSKDSATADVESLTAQISALNEELEMLRSAKQSPETPAAGVEASQAASLSKYQNCLTEVESMLDSLGARVQQEHSKIAISLSSKDDELSQVKLQLADTISRHSTDSAKQVSLTAQLGESKKKITELEKLLAEQTAASKAEAAAMASSGADDDSGTCV